MSGWPNRRSDDSSGNSGGFGRALAGWARDTVAAWQERSRLLWGRWRRLGGGERWNIALYVLTGVSMLALTVEFLAGPDTLPTEVTSAPPQQVGSSGLTPVIPSSTTTLVLATEEDAPVLVQGPPRSAAPRPAAAQPRANAQPAPAPVPTDPPATEPPPTEPPPTAPPTSKPATTISTGFTVVPPVPPSFPSNVPTGNP
jgi:hypothetical protein